MEEKESSVWFYHPGTGLWHNPDPGTLVYKRLAESNEYQPGIMGKKGPELLQSIASAIEVKKPKSAKTADTGKPEEVKPQDTKPEPEPGTEKLDKPGEVKPEEVK